MDLLLAQRLELFAQLMECGQNLFFWEYDPDMKLIKTSSPEAEPLHTFFTMSDCYPALADYIHNIKPLQYMAPLILSNRLGLSWIAALEYVTDKLCRCYILGPVFNSDVSFCALEQELYRKQVSKDMMSRFVSVLRSLPVVPLYSWLRSGLMLHMVLTGEKIEISDFHYLSENDQSRFEENERLHQQPRRSTWLAEQAAMQMIEEGQLDYRRSYGQLSNSVNFVAPTREREMSRKLKNSVISFITLSTRAAIRGGLDPETAYFIGDYYIQAVEKTTTLSELMQLNGAMYDDFIHRVHKLKRSEGISPAIQACRNYIELHIRDKLTLDDISKDTGYSSFYLAQKFKKEMGVTISQYVKERKVKQAKVLLRSTTKTVLEISEELGYSTPSRFAEVFRSLEHISPSEFREQKE